MHDGLQIALRRDVLLPGMKVGWIVGTALVEINQGDLILSGALGPSAASKILLTYLVPYSVSPCTGVSAIRAIKDETTR